MSHPFRLLRQELEALQRAGVSQVPAELAELATLLVAAARPAAAGRSGPAAFSSGAATRGSSSDRAVAATRPTLASTADPATTDGASTGPASADRATTGPATARSAPPSQQAAVLPSPALPTVPRPGVDSAFSAPMTRPLYENAQPPQEYDPAMTKIQRPCSKLSLDARVSQLDALKKKVAVCQRCQELASSRTQTVFGVGNPEARIMFIGEAPGADEDKQGEPFVGRAGQLLNKIIEAARLTREEIYICNILRCRPPGNRAPVPDEAANCREFLDGQIELVDPEYIVCWGSTAAHNLLNTKTSIGQLRGKFFDYRGIKVICTYHPSYLLRQPSAKAQVWDDMKFFRREMGVELA